MGRLGLLRWGDAAVAWALAWVVVVSLGRVGPLAGLLLASAVVAAGAGAASLRVRWRPVTAAVSVGMSRGIRAGARAWYVRAHGADLVLVTARRGLRVVIAGLADRRSEGLAVRRTRVLLLPADTR